MLVNLCQGLLQLGRGWSTCFCMLSSVRVSEQVKHWPNTEAVARRLAQEFGSPGLEQQLKIHALKCVQPGLPFLRKNLE